MGSTRNAILSVAAAGLLIAGLLVLIPEPARAAQPGAPTVALSDFGTTTDGNLKTTLTTVVTIPQGKLIPLEYVEVILGNGAVNPFTSTTGNSIMDNGVIRNCGVGTITSWGGATQTFGTFSSPGYSIDADSYGYGYAFGSAGSDVLSGYGTGYGYGSTTQDLRVTVTVEINNCPQVSDFASTGGILRAFHFQLAIGGDSTHVFYSIPTTLTIRNPESTNTCATTAAGTMNTNIQDSGSQTTFTMQMQAGASLTGSDCLATTSSGPTFTPTAGGAQTFVQSAQVNINQALPEGANLVMSIIDMDSSGGTFPSGTSAFGIPAADLATRTGGAAYAGFFSLTMNGLPAGSTPGQYVDVVLTLNVPTTYFTVNSLTVGNFHLVRYSDAGVFLADIPCTFVAVVGADQQFTCTITDFSSFAMVASAISSGGGGGVTTTTTTSSTITTTSTTTTTTGTDTSTSTVTTTGSDTGSSTKGKGKGGSAPGLEFGLLVGALAGIALLARRKLK